MRSLVSGHFFADVRELLVRAQFDKVKVTLVTTLILDFLFKFKARGPGVGPGTRNPGLGSGTQGFVVRDPRAQALGRRSEGPELWVRDVSPVSGTGDPDIGHIT